MPDPPTDLPLASVLGKVAAAMNAQLSPGDVAAIRRGDPTSPPLAVQKLLAFIVEPAGWLNGATRESDWAAIAQGFAIMGTFHAHDRRPGAALNQAGYSDLRLSRLLRSERPALYGELRAAAKFLVQKGQPANWGGLGTLALFPVASEAGRRLRGSLAREFYRAQSTSDSDTPTTTA